MPHRVLAFLVGGLLLALALPALAAAAPVTVNFRIEGKTRTLYEGRVTTDVGPIDVGDGTGPHACDGTTTPGVTVPAPTRGNAFFSAARGPGGFTFTGTFTFDLQFSVIAGDPVAFDPGTGEFLAEYKNGAFAAVGSCGDQIRSGDDVLYAYATGSEQLLKLSGPSIVAPGASAALTVTDAATGLPVAGADVGGVTSGPDGTVHPTLADRGPHPFKASKTGAIRSNRVDVCVTDGADGACSTTLAGPATGTGAAPVDAACATTGTDGLCGTRDSTAPSASISGIAEHRHFARGKGPRTLHVNVKPDVSGLLTVKLRLTRTDGPRCTYFSGRSERFRIPRGAKCGADNGFWFAVGDREQTSYLLPRALPRGRYVLDANAIDKSFNRDDARRRGSNRVVFFVS